MDLASTSVFLDFDGTMTKAGADQGCASTGADDGFVGDGISDRKAALLADVYDALCR